MLIVKLLFLKLKFKRIDCVKFGPKSLISIFHKMLVDQYVGELLSQKSKFKLLLCQNRSKIYK